MTASQSVAAYVRFFETLSPQTLHHLDALCTPDVRFRDPFNDVRGVAAFRAVLAKMFRDIAKPRFQVSDRAFSGNVCYLRWTFTFSPAGRRGAEILIDGVSEVHFDASGRVSQHLDYWDAGSHVYARIPLLGSLIRLVRRRLAIPS